MKEWRGVFTNRPPEFLAFLQTWLFFGVMELVLGEHIQLSDFTREDGNSGQKVVTMVKFVPALRKWLVSTTTHYIDMADYVGVGYFTLQKAIRMHYYLLGLRHDSPDGLVDESQFLQLSSFIDQVASPDRRDARVTASTVALYEALYHSYPRTLQHMTKQLERPLVFPGYFAGNLIAFEGVDVISQQMQRDGWCPSELSMMFRRLNYISICFMSRLERPGPSKEHLVIQTQPLPSSDSVSAVPAERGERRSGELCSKSKCSLYTLHEETYRTKHVDGCTNCYDIVADENEITRILNNNRIPLILCMDNESKSTNITPLNRERMSHTLQFLTCGRMAWAMSREALFLVAKCYA